MSNSDELLGRHRAVMPSWLSLLYEHPIELVSGSGCWVTDSDGNDYLDFFGGILTTMTGHAVPEVVDAIRSQAGRILHSSTLYLIRPMVELAEKVASLSGIPDAKVFFVNSGSEANDTALMLCCAARRSNQVLAMRNSYHGRSFAAMAVTGNSSWSSSSLSPFQVSYLHGGDRLRGPFAGMSDQDHCRLAADDLRETLDTTTAGDVACLIAEPIQGVGGFVVPPDGLFGALKEVLDERGILFVADEVQTGWGRTGEHFWGYQAHSITPDVITFAKGLGNGLAMGGVVGRADLIDSVHVNSISTFGGNPLASAGALANLEYLLSHDMQSNAQRVGNLIIEGLRSSVGHLSAIVDIRGKGLMIGVELVEPSTHKPDPTAATKVVEEARALGLLIGRGGLRGNVLRIAPPLSLNDTEAKEGTERLIAAVRAATGKRVTETL
ncbi:MAG: aspartate aminotransferase family protein [Acidimicrobiales bacterium]